MKVNLKPHSETGLALTPTLRRFNAVACLLLAAAVSAPAAVVYTSSYDGSTLPTATAGTTANPKWALGGATGTFSAGNSGGSLNAVTTGTLSTQWWAVGTNGGVAYAGSTANVWNTSTATVDFNLQVTAGVGGNVATGNGFAIQLTDLSNRFFNFYIGPTTFLYQTGASTGTSITTASLGIDTSLFHSYRIAMDAGKASLYIDGNTTPIFNMVSGFTLGATRTAMIFGDLSSAESGSFNLDSLSWSNTTADFSPIPEPGTAALAGLGCFLGLIALRRRRAVLR